MKFYSFLENVSWFDDFKAKYTKIVTITLNKQQNKICFHKEPELLNISEVDVCYNELSEFLKVNVL